MKKFLFALLLLLGGFAAPAQDTFDYQTASKLVFDHYNHNDYGPIYQRYSPERKASMSLQQNMEYFMGLKHQVGNVVGVQLAGMGQGAATYIVTFERGTLQCMLALNRVREISGLEFAAYNPPSPYGSPYGQPQPYGNQNPYQSPYGNQNPYGQNPYGNQNPYGGNPYANQNPYGQNPYGQNPSGGQSPYGQPVNVPFSLRLPLASTSVVMSPANPAECHPSQRAAIDLMQVDKSGNARRGRRNDLYDYVGYGSGVYAPCDGVVALVIDGVPDNPLGQNNPAAPLGNCVVIQTPQGLFLVLAHLQRSIKVQTGQPITHGTLMGFCGNSGESVEPHVHMHIQDRPDFNTALGVPCVFDRLVVNGTSRSGYSPAPGEVVKNALF